MSTTARTSPKPRPYRRRYASRWWYRADTGRPCKQWGSRLHPDFLFVAVRGCQVVKRTGNAIFDLITTKPQPIHEADTPAGALAFARRFIQRNSGRDYCTAAAERFAKRKETATP